jgi:hypothetical protein
MIRLTGVCRIQSATFDELDRMSGQIIQALMLNDSVIGSEIAVSLEESVFQIEMVIDTADPWKAATIGEKAMRPGFVVASMEPPDQNQLFAHRDLLQPTPVKVETVLVDA